MRENPSHVARRSELLAEVFLQDLNPAFLGRPSSEIGFDFLIGFANTQGGVNTFAVEVKPTENLSSEWFPLEGKAYRRLANSNVPAFLLVVDAKKNRLFYAWPERISENGQKPSQKVKLPVIEINDQTKRDLQKRLAA